MTTAITGPRQRLADVRERTSAARGARQRARTTLEAARAAGDNQAASIASLAMDQAQTELETSEALEGMVLSSMAGVSTHSFGESFLDDPKTVATLEQLAFSTQPIGNVMLGQLMDADRFAASLSPRAQGDPMDPALLMGKRTDYSRPIQRQPYRALTLLDLLNTGTMTGAQIEYVVELGELDGAFETEEGAIKPQGEVLFEEATAPARTIAIYIKQRRQVLADVPELSQVLTTRLTYQVQRRVEQQVLIGDGVGQNLLGLLNQTGIGTIGPDAAVTDSDMILKGMTQVTLNNAVPNGVVLNPLDHETMLLEKTTGSGERLDSAGAFETPANGIWGLPVIRSQVIPQGTALVGDFNLACTLLVREGVSVRVSDADQDDFIRNRVTLLAEARVAIPVWQPGALCEVTLAP